MNSEERLFSRNMFFLFFCLSFVRENAMKNNNRRYKKIGIYKRIQIDHSVDFSVSVSLHSIRVRSIVNCLGIFVFG